MKLLLVSATEMEIAPTLALLREQWEASPGAAFRLGEVEVHICIGGVGMMTTAYHLIKKMNEGNFGFALQAGIAGSYSEDLALADVVHVQSEQFGDLGAEDHYNFLDVFDLGFAGRDEIPFKEGKLIAPETALEAELPETKVKGLSVNATSGSSFTVKARKEKYACDIESMEGLAFHYVCLKENIPFAQVRSISNYVTPRNRESWQIKEALESLNRWLWGFLRQLAGR